MTNLDQAAAALDTAAEALATAALALRAETSQEPQKVPASEENFQDYFDDLDAKEAAAVKPAGSASVCPAHNIEYRAGKYGPYCPSLGTDPKWTNARGYCQITPEKAAAYLRQKAAA